jgi:chitinase
MWSLVFLIFSQHAFASYIVNSHVPQASSCIQTTWSNSGSKYWQTIYLTFTNQCGMSVDFQNTTVTFLNKSNLNTSFWGQFNPLSYPDNNLQITSQPQFFRNYLSTFYLHFPNYTGANSVLPNKKSFTVIYGAPSADFIANSVNVYLGTPVNTGEIDFINTSSQPVNVSQSYALIHVDFNGQPLMDVQTPWASTVKMNNLVAGTYTLLPVNITDSYGNVYQGTANPATISLTSGSIVSSNITYSMIQPNGSIAFKVQALPAELSGYTDRPSVLLKSQTSSTNAIVNWNTTTTVSNLINGTTYSFESPTISYNGYSCVPIFNPTFATASATTPIVNVSYTCIPVVQDTITVNVSGLSSSTPSIAATFTPNNGSSPVTQTINLTNGQGSGTVKLVDGVIYTVSSTSVNGYTVSFAPQPLTAIANATEAITYSAISTGAGRIIGYIPGWKTPPTASDLSTAGYTHMLVAFGVFSTTNPGQITSAFDTITVSYIKSLQNLGIKVLLSLGGASTNIPNTTVNFHQVLSSASSPDAFTQTFIMSLENLITTYGFDGFDFNIESGLNAGGTFTNPQGDIAVLANIINTLHAKHPLLLLTLAPQTANISATSNFNETWGNYSSLIMQIYNSLDWVGVQIYNSGCMLGIDSVCYDPNATNSPNFSVAMAADLLENWPISSGFQPYISYLKPSQVVLGYLIPNAQGKGDGTPIYPNSTIKRAIQCLRTAVKNSNSCDTYAPPKAYPGLGGVFGWEVTYDQNNNYKFATGLKDCVVNGVC